MEFYIVKDTDFIIKAQGGMDGQFREIRRSSLILIELEPLEDPIQINENEENDPPSYCQFLMSSLVQGDGVINISLEHDSISKYLQLCIDIPVDSASEEQKGYLMMSSVGNENADDETVCILGRLVNIYRTENVKVNLKISSFNCSEEAYRSETDFGFEVNSLEIGYIPDTTNRYGISTNDLNLPANQVTPWNQGKRFSGKLTVTVSLSDEAVNRMYAQNLWNWQIHFREKIVLEEAICSDLVIVASNGAEVKCHKVYLAGISDVFKAMFESRMKEATTNSIEMPDMSEAGVRAFLAFIYYWNLTEASRSCEIAFELYCAAHKYNIEILDEAMIQLIIAKPNAWFDVDVAVRIFIFANNLSVFGEKPKGLLKKSVQVLRWYNMMDADKTRDSAEYQRHFAENPLAAMKLTNYFLTIK